MTDARRNLHRLLTEVPVVYATLAECLLPGGAGGDDGMPRTPKDPLNRPAPANLELVDHRHTLVRGLRWWVDAVREQGQRTEVGHDVTRMCAWLLGHLEVMAPEDHRELAANLGDWLGAAYPLTGHRSEPAVAVRLPEGAEDAHMPVHEAARLLGVSVRTIQRRAARRDGLVRLGDVLGQVRTVTVPLAH